MAHIADCLLDGSTSTIGLNNYIAKELSPSSDHGAIIDTLAEEKDRFVWRMHQPVEPRKFQLFPAKDKFSMTGRASPDPDTAFNLVMGNSGGSVDRGGLGLGGALRLKLKGQALTGRRKVSVPELGPMTTVQEITMDSPTIPGRPPLHERSISAPGNSWRHQIFGDAILGNTMAPVLDVLAESNNPTDSRNKESRMDYMSPKQPLSPKSLAPLLIPQSNRAPPQRVLVTRYSSSKLRSNSTSDIGPEVPPKTRILDIRNSPQSRTTTPFTPFTPMSSTTSLSQSSVPTPMSAPAGRASPKPWTSQDSTSPLAPLREGAEDPSLQPKCSVGHRREQSETSIIDRGRPKKRSDGSPIKRLARKSPTMEKKGSFEDLPNGTRVGDVKSKISQEELNVIRSQAIRHVANFEILSMRDVDGLSKELISLDERCEYLRKTHHSLRSGRRNLHERICNYLRSPRMAKFSNEAMLKQEEALAELDVSIDDWVSKLEQAESRRLRIRQKLLKHVAAALMIPEASQDGSFQLKRSLNMPTGENTPPRSPTRARSSSPRRYEDGVRGESQRQQVAENQVVKAQSEEDRPAEKMSVVEDKTDEMKTSAITSSAQAPPKAKAPVIVVAAPQIINDGELKEMGSTPSDSTSPSASERRDVQSIRIYANTDVYTLLDDVEEEINRMGLEA